MASERRDEVVRTYAVDEATVLPTVTGVDGVARMGPGVERELEAVYFDTGELDLARRGITVRRRTGGEDEGWQVRLPSHGDVRTEVRAPLGRAAGTVPEPLRAPLLAVVRDRPLLRVAKVTTRRIGHDVVAQDDTVLARVCDDTVRAEQLLGSGLVQQWREWKVELADGDDALLDRVGHRLLGAGAATAAASSELLRTLGDTVPSSPRPLSRKQLSKALASEVLRRRLAAQVVELQEQDRQVRAGAPTSIHKMRIAARRLRSALKTYAPLLGDEPTSTLRDDLRWLGQILSPARDAQVLRERLGTLVAAEPPELVLGPVAESIDSDLRSTERAGRTAALEAMGDPRYFRLLDALDHFVEHPPVIAEADGPARAVLPRLLQRDAKRLRRAVESADQLRPGAERDGRLHESRKKAKRLRYAAESTVPVLGKPAKRLVRKSKRVQRALGEHQDTVIARQVLRDLGAREHTAQHNGFTFGRLHALEQQRADAAEQSFRQAWSGLPTSRLRRWLAP